MRVVRIEKDGEVEFLAQTAHQSRKLANTDKVALPFRCTYQDRDVQFARRGEYSLQQNQVGNIKVANGDAVFLCLRQRITQPLHVASYGTESHRLTSIAKGGQRHLVSQRTEEPNLRADLIDAPGGAWATKWSPLAGS